ncbi:MAG TPA: hypothetical protein VH253_19170 [Phycisphaerae bacterium]|nr:hypothetical protein [Phycisphaerae bacterium]
MPTSMKSSRENEHTRTPIRVERHILCATAAGKKRPRPVPHALFRRILFMRRIHFLDHFCYDLTGESGARMTSSAAIVREHTRAAKKAMKEALRSPKDARAFLIRAGILTKSGKRLARPYR